VFLWAGWVIALFWLYWKREESPDSTGQGAPRIGGVPVYHAPD